MFQDLVTPAQKSERKHSVLFDEISHREIFEIWRINKLFEDLSDQEEDVWHISMCWSWMRQRLRQQLGKVSKVLPEQGYVLSLLCQQERYGNANICWKCFNPRHNWFNVTNEYRQLPKFILVLHYLSTLVACFFQVVTLVNLILSDAPSIIYLCGQSLLKNYRLIWIAADWSFLSNIGLKWSCLNVKSHE